MKSTIFLLTKSNDSRVLRKSASLREVNYNMALQNAKEKKSIKGRQSTEISTSCKNYRTQ